MDFDDALELLGLTRTADWRQVRASYRTAMRRAHPDLGHDDGDRARSLNEAFAVLEPVVRRGHPAPAPTGAVDGGADRSTAPTAPTDPTAPSGPVEVSLVDDDGLVLVAPADEVFDRLVRAVGEFGHVTHVDPDNSYLEAALDGGSATLSVSLQGRAFHTEVFFTLHTAPGSVPRHLDDVVRAIANRVRN